MTELSFSRTSTQAEAALAHDGVILLREAPDDAVVDGRCPGRLVHLLICRIWPAIPAPAATFCTSSLHA